MYYVIEKKDRIRDDLPIFPYFSHQFRSWDVIAHPSVRFHLSNPALCCRRRSQIDPRLRGCSCKRGSSGDGGQWGAACGNVRRRPVGRSAGQAAASRERHGASSSDASRSFSISLRSGVGRLGCGDGVAKMRRGGRYAAAGRTGCGGRMLPVRCGGCLRRPCTSPAGRATS
jgi:hypothetical protein